VSKQGIDDMAELQKFTKNELIEYILAISFMVRQHPPVQTILELKAEKIHKKIDKNLQEMDALITAAQNKQITAGEFSERHYKLSAQWTRLNDELRSIENKLYKR
jgi:predicted nuclease with TOPRIM domain